MNMIVRYCPARHLNLKRCHYQWPWNTVSNVDRPVVVDRLSNQQPWQKQHLDQRTYVLFHLWRLQKKLSYLKKYSAIQTERLDLPALCSFPHADKTNASLTDTQTISSMPLALISSAFSIYPGRWVCKKAKSNRHSFGCVFCVIFVLTRKQTFPI